MRKRQRRTGKGLARCALVLMLLLAALAYAEGDNPGAPSSDLGEILARYMAQIPGGEISLLSEELVLLYERGREVMPLVEPYFTNESLNVRLAAYTQYGAAGAKLENLSERQACVKTLVQALAREADRSEKETPEWGAIVDALKVFLAEDFSQDVKGVLLQEAEKALRRPAWDVANKSLMLRLLGLTGIEEAKPLLAEAIEIDRNPENAYESFRGAHWQLSLGWNAMLASARIYQSPDIQLCIDTVEQRSYNQYRTLRMYGRDLAYIRRPEIAEYFLKLLNDDTQFPAQGCSPPDSYARRAMEFLCEILPEMGPTLRQIQKVREAELGRGLEDSEIVALCREWANNRDNWRKFRR